MKKIYMIAGTARSGKDTISNFIKEIYQEENKKTIILQISSTLKYYAEKVLNWNELEETKPREFLQKTGDIARSYNEKFLIQRLIDDAKILFNYVDVIVVSDVRLPLEFEEVSKHFDSINILVKRPNFDNNLTNSEKRHITETGLDNYSNYKYIIENNSTLENLKEKIIDIIREETK